VLEVTLTSVSVKTVNPVNTINLAWRQKGACRGLDPTIFYPPTEEEAEMAKSVCEECHVSETCLEYALGHRERDGVWGGATERDRRRIIRQRRRSA
jgi:WhiB family redox-sensing transcriptional regulator